jgi:hypothetical protein
MKNKLFTGILLFVTLTGCSLFYPINTQVDEFKHTKKITLEIGVLPTEHLINSATSTNITFEKCISESGETLNAYFVLNRNSSSFKLEKDCFVKAFGKSYEIAIENQETVNRSQILSMTQSSSVKDSTKVKTESKTMSNSYDYYEEKFVIRFTPEMVESIKKTDELIFRYYLGPNQATFRITGIPLKRLKYLLSI